MERKEVVRLSARGAADRMATALSGEMDHQQAEAVAGWCESNSERGEEFLAVSAIYADMGRLSNDQDVLAALKEARNPGVSSRLGQSMWLAAACCVLGVAVWLSFLSTVEPVADGGDRYLTRIGEQKEVTLADGSLMHMNTGTEVLVRLSDSHRQLVLIRGEVFFDVAKDPARPFSVDLGVRSITVLGTAFNVRRNANDFSLAVTEGVVSLHRKEEEVLSMAPLLTGGEDGESWVAPFQRRVSAGIQVTFDFESRKLQSRKLASAESVSEWRDGILSFYSVPLSGVVKELNRYSPKKIIIEDVEAMALGVYGTVKLSSIPAALEQFEINLPVKVVHEFDQISIRSKK